MRRRWLAAVGLVSVAACAELFGPRAYTVSLTIVPVFDVADPHAVAAAASADRLRIRALRDSAGAFTVTVKDTIVDIDPETGEASATLTLVLLQSPTLIRLILEAIRSSDGVILFSGTADVQVTSSAGGTDVSTDSIPLPYVGPRAARVAIAPRDTAIATGGTFTYRATAFDSTGNVLTPQPQITFLLVNPADSSTLRVVRLTGSVSAGASATGEVRVYAEAPGPTSGTVVRDTGRVYVGAVAVGVRVTPGYANISLNDTLRLRGELVDPLGTPLTSSGVTLTSRDPGVATVDGSGLLQGVATGTVVIVATGSGFSDSAQFTVATASHAVVSSTSNKPVAPRAFGVFKAGVDTVVMDVTADMRFTPNEKLGSYNATLTWSPSVLQYLDVQTTTFAAPVVNPDGASVGTLRFSAADAGGAAGAVVVARVRFRAVAQGETTAALAISEMSAAQTFTNLSALNRVTVTSGHVTVRP